MRAGRGLRRGGLTRAWVVVSTKAGQAKRLAQLLGKLPGVELADCCWGRRDVIVFAEVADARALDRLVLDGSAKVRAVEVTETHIVLGP